MNTSKFILFSILLLFLLNKPLFASQINSEIVECIFSQTSNNLSKQGDIDINWDKLNLTEEQEQKIQELDKQWNKINQTLRPKIVRDQQQLKNIMTNPNVKEENIRSLQRNIMTKKDQLQIDATENFLAKRKVLTPEQLKKLHQMMPK